MLFNPERLFANKALVILIICCLGLIIYSNTFNSPFHFDDYTTIVKNPSLRNPYDLKAVFSFWPPRFITYLSFAVNYHFFRLNVFSYHLVNILIHLGSSILAWLFTLAVFSTPAMKKQEITEHKYLIALFSGLIFVAHPIQTQAVTYIVQRAASLAALFYLTSLCLYIKARLLKPETGKPDTGKFYYFCSLITAIMAMFTKEIAITLPLMIVLIEYCFFKEEEGINWKKAIPFLALLLLIPLTLLFAKLINAVGIKSMLEYGPTVSSLSYLLTELRVIVTYIRLLFVPVNQNLDYDYPIIRSLTEFPALSSILFLAVILIITVRIFPRFRMISFGAFWFFLTLMPESSIIPLQDVIFEHRLYLPMVGFSILLAGAVFHTVAGKKTKIKILILSLLVGLYAGLAGVRNTIWQNDIILNADIVSKSPEKARGYNNLANAYAAVGLYDQAIRYLIKAIKIAPDYDDANYNLGIVYNKKSDLNRALFYFNRAIEINPNDTEAYYYRGSFFNDTGKYLNAITDLQKVLELDPGYIEAYHVLSGIYRRIGKDDDARLLYQNAILANPGLAEFYVGLAVLYGDAGDHQETIRLCMQAIKLKPDSAQAYTNLCSACGILGDFKKAMTYCQKAIKIEPDSGLSQMNLSVAYFYTKQYDLAIKHCDKAVALRYKVNPDYLEALKPHRKQQ